MNNYLSYDQAIKFIDDYFDNYFDRLNLDKNNTVGILTARNYFMRIKRLVLKDVKERIQQGALFTKEMLIDLCKKVDDEHKNEFFEIYKRF